MNTAVPSVCLAFGLCHRGVCFVTLFYDRAVQDCKAKLLKLEITRKARIGSRLNLRLIKNTKMVCMEWNGHASLMNRYEKSLQSSNYQVLDRY